MIFQELVRTIIQMSNIYPIKFLFFSFIFFLRGLYFEEIRLDLLEMQSHWIGMSIRLGLFSA